MRIAPLGPETIQIRIRQIEERISQLFQRMFSAQSVQPPPLYSESFSTSSFAPLSGRLPVGRLPDWAIPVGSSVSPFVPTEMTPSNIGIGLEELQQMADNVAAEVGIDSVIFRALIGVESRWNPNAISPTGAQGLAQLKPEVARELGVTDPFDPMQSLRGGAKYFRQMLTEFGSLEAALAAYNVGPGVVRRYGGPPPFVETNDFVRRVLKEIKQ